MVANALRKRWTAAKKMMQLLHRPHLDVLLVLLCPRPDVIAQVRDEGVPLAHGIRAHMGRRQGLARTHSRPQDLQQQVHRPRLFVSMASGVTWLKERGWPMRTAGYGICTWPLIKPNQVCHEGIKVKTGDGRLSHEQTSNFFFRIARERIMFSLRSRFAM